MQVNPPARGATEIVSVDSSFTDQGFVVVKSFSWKGMNLPVTDLGRQWLEPTPAGTRRCVLVMAGDYGTFELCLEPSDMLWHARCISGTDPVA